MPAAHGVIERIFGLANGFLVLAADRRNPGEEPAKQRQRILRTKLACELSSLDAKKLRFVEALLRELVQGMRAERVDEDPDRPLRSRQRGGTSEERCCLLLLPQQCCRQCGPHAVSRIVGNDRRRSEAR